MRELINEFLNRNRTKAINIFCVGDAMVDEYYDVKVNRISPEFPMPILLSENDVPICRPGGVANVAYQFKHFNVAVNLQCFQDRYAEKIKQKHGLYNIGAYVLPIKNAKLPIKRRFLDNGIQITRQDIENSLCGLKPENIDKCILSLRDFIVKHQCNPDVVILSDYNKGFFSSENINVLDIYRGMKTIVDPKKGPLSKWIGCTIFKPNFAEAEALSGKKEWQDQVRFFQSELKCESVVITHGGDKVVGIHNGELFCHKLDVKVNVDSVVGAGDCFCAFLAMAVGQGFETPDAAKIAHFAGSFYVQHRMNKPVSPAELCINGLVNPEDLKKRDFKLVFTNGCFDVLHEGHMESLKFAKSKGDKLVVALNSDESVKRLKGENRPIVPLHHRLAVMSNIRHVDFVCSFDDDTPFQIVRQIRPDVIVKGSDYKKSEIVGAEIAKEVYLAPLIKGVSTTKLLNNH